MFKANRRVPIKQDFNLLAVFSCTLMEEEKSRDIYTDLAFFLPYNDFFGDLLSLFFSESFTQLKQTFNTFPVKRGGW